MGSSVIGLHNRFLFGALSAGNAVTAVSNLANQYCTPARSWSTASGVTTPGAGAWLVLDTGMPEATWRALGIFRTNLSASAVVKWIIGPNAAGTSPVYSATTTAQCDPAFGGQVIHILPSTVTARFLRIEITDSAAAGGYVRVGLAFGGPALQPVINIDYGSSFGSISGEIVTTTRGGIEAVTETWQARTATANWSGLTPAEADALFDLDAEARYGMNCLYVPNDTSPMIHREAVFGRVQMNGTLGYAGNGDPAQRVKLVYTERVG